MRDLSSLILLKATTATLYLCSYLRNSAQYDLEFLGSQPQQDAQLGAWEIDLPPNDAVCGRGRTTQFMAGCRRRKAAT